jgi:hypothetical protein
MGFSEVQQVGHLLVPHSDLHASSAFDVNQWLGTL